LASQVRAVGFAEVQRLALVRLTGFFAEFYAVNRRNGFSDALHPALAGSHFVFPIGFVRAGNRAVLPLGVLHFLGWKLLFAEANRIILFK